MTPLFKEKTVIELLATEINNNFTQQQKEKLHFLIGTSDIIDYAGIKLLAKNIKNYLVDESYAIKHGQVLNILAKSYGFSNHHSMTASFKEQVRYYEGTTNLFKIFQAREELFELFDSYHIDFKVLYYINSGLEFILAYSFGNIPKEPDSIYEKIEHRQKYKKYKYQAKLKINKLAKEYELKPLKNTLPLMRLFHKKGIDAYKFREIIVKRYKDFFNPVWIEKGEVQSVRSLQQWFFLTYENISIRSDLLYVGSYSSDLQWHEIKNFLTFLIRYGEVDDFIFIESLLRQEEILPRVNRNSLSKNLLLRKYEKFKFIENFIEQYRHSSDSSLKSILESMTFVVSLTKEDMQLLNQYADDVKDVISYFDFMNNLSTILIRCCIENINEQDRYNKIEKTLYLDFLHYEEESKIIEVKKVDNSKDIVLVTRLRQLIEVVCSRIEELVEKNKLELK
jgi:hypothetical protein